ncbi:hypothetical protein EV643_111230 [Kribbella sp. VKM Ac-2527]|uniref:PBP family phospholipid-binding protein n=1 Tax=Kribbella caucasensis TaxID=2512215 RepID=A0A4V3C9P0_9ACTN|nr:YbhB/YbcL family Raf kinase inhibitor-like protein [Kribbella sp. VKM Ac-2527]TDO46377.1 hypothetical protein EV643_111230 [Kribbella sp. VKM Ac-2527]
MGLRPLHAVVLALLVGPAGCSDTSARSGQEPIMSITVTSTAFSEGGRIPSKFTCDSDNVSPPLTWRGLPANTTALALVVDDPDAPRGTYVHWVLLDLPADLTSLGENLTPPPGTVQAKNSAGRATYFGPCPPSGTHHYRFTIYALSAPTDLPPGAPLDEALKAIKTFTIAQGRLTGLYSR